MAHILNDTATNSLILLVLDHYKHGQYAFNEDLKSQSSQHSNNKRYVKEYWLDFLKVMGDHKFMKYFSALLTGFKELDPDSLNKLRDKNNDLMISNKKLRRNMEGQTTHTCGSCHSIIKEMVEKKYKTYIDTYVCHNEDINQLKERVDYLNKENVSLFNKMTMANQRLNDIHTNNKVVPNDTYEELIGNSNKYVMESKAKKSKKPKRSKKQIKRDKLKKQMKALESSDESDSSDSSD